MGMYDITYTPCYTIVYYTNYTILWYTILYYILYYTILYYTILYYSVLPVKLIFLEHCAYLLTYLTLLHVEF